MQMVWVAKGCFVPAGLKGEKRQDVESGVVKTKRSNKQLVAFDILDGETAAAIIPEHQTCLGKGFWMGKFEVTQAQYEQFMGVNPSSFNKGGDYPVENVRWLEARAFLRKLNAGTGKEFRLPSEAEWEYAAKSGANAQGNVDSIDDSAWYLANSNGSTHPVGQKQANGLGIYDMRGNVWEWTQDCWNEDVHAAPSDGSAWLTGECGARVLRGGSWYDDQSMLSDKARVYNDSDSADNNSGFRIVLDNN
ncbi:formylglycine-generating enzyme family protein [Mariprofundus ferrooxydans]|nr:formylglycine-generating enzyme family protein [Mariprofundus ferrooxydans]